MDGYEGMILQTLSDKLNFTFELIECKMRWGMKHKNGSWDGIVGAVYHGVVKIVSNDHANFYFLRKPI